MSDRKEAAAELLRRQKIRGSLVEFMRACGYKPAPHHVYIIGYLEKIASGKLQRLLCAAPPGSSKSTLVSILFTAWYLSQHPEHQIICASHTVELAEKHARQARNLIMEHSATLGIELADDSQSAGRWSLKTGGSVFAVGSGGAAVGRRADVLCIDDPLRGTEDAHSENARDKLYDWFVSDLLTRLRPGGKIVCISTIWHEDDLFSRLAATGRYEVIRLPAVAEAGEICPLGRVPGQYLWDSDPEYPYDQFLRVQRENQLPSNWSALFQCRPAPEQGDYFRSEWFKPMTVMPQRDQLHIYGASDYAVSANRGDYSVHIIVGQSSDGLFLLDCWRAQAATDVSVEKFCDLVLQWKPIGWACEKGQLANAIEPYMKIRQRARNASVAMEMFPTRGDKSVRCQSIRGRLSLGGIFVNTQAEYWPACFAEAKSFPVAATDDFCDALGLIGQILDRMSSPYVPTPKPPNKTIVIGGPSTCTLEDLFTANETRRGKSGFERIK